MFQGIITAIITPFRERKIDFDALAKIIDFQAKAGIKAIAVCGTTGEGPLLSQDEKCELVAKAVEFAQGRLQIIVGTGAPTTEETIEMNHKAEKLGAAGLLIIAPWYVKPNQEGLFHHFKAIHEATSLPFIIDNNPGRTGVDIAPETVGRLSELPQFAIFKDCSTDLTRVQKIRNLKKGPLFIYSGDDLTAPGHLGMGGDGIIGVASNVAPTHYIALYEAWKIGDLKTFASLRDQLYVLAAATNLESSPAPIKYAASLLGFCQDESRLPFAELHPVTKEAVQKALALLKLEPLQFQAA